jgi:hypothetical protein
MRLRRTILVSLAVLAVLAVSAASAAVLDAARKPAVAPYRLSGMKTMLFYEHTGTFSGDLLTQPGIALWNTIIGEGDAKEPSHSVLVVVQVSGEAGSSEDARRVELTASEGSKVILRQAQELGVLSARGRTHVGFWLYDVGCERVRLRARLVGQAQESPRTAEIPFECGE